MKTEKTKKPNIILIVSDDHGYADRGYLGVHEDVHTPALDRIAREGATMTDAYVTAPICSPSRSGFITGQYQQRWGTLWFDSASFPPDPAVKTLPEVLRAAGYRTGYFGKVHYGGEDVGERACPPHHGYEETFYGLAGQSYGRLNYLRHSRDAQDEYGEAAVPMAVQPMLSGDEPVEFEGFLTDELGRRAREFVTAEDARPFFCTLAFNAVHNFCWQLPPEELQRRNLPVFRDWHPHTGISYGEWYDDVIVPNLPHGREYYLAQLELMDRQIGLLLDALDRQGIAQDTIVVYLTDNGGSPCNYGSNEPLRGTKYTVWEGGIRVPMMWRWPEHIPAGVSLSEIASSLDLLPTLSAFAGVDPMGSSDGADLSSILIPEDGARGLRGDRAVGARSGDDVAGEVAQEPRTLHWECGWQFAVRNGKWKMSWVDGQATFANNVRNHEHAPVGDGLFLADLDNDLAETTNLADTHPQVVSDLLQKHAAWIDEVGLPEHFKSRV